MCLNTRVWTRLLFDVYMCLNLGLLNNHVFWVKKFIWAMILCNEFNFHVLYFFHQRCLNSNTGFELSKELLHGDWKYTKLSRAYDFNSITLILKQLLDLNDLFFRSSYMILIWGNTFYNAKNIIAKIINTPLNFVDSFSYWSKLNN